MLISIPAWIKSKKLGMVLIYGLRICNCQCVSSPFYFIRSSCLTPFLGKSIKSPTRNFALPLLTCLPETSLRIIRDLLLKNLQFKSFENKISFSFRKITYWYSNCFPNLRHSRHTEFNHFWSNDWCPFIRSTFWNILRNGVKVFLFVNWVIFCKYCKF